MLSVFSGSLQNYYLETISNSILLGYILCLMMSAGKKQMFNELTNNLLEESDYEDDYFEIETDFHTEKSCECENTSTNCDANWKL